MKALAKLKIFRNNVDGLLYIDDSDLLDEIIAELEALLSENEKLKYDNDHLSNMIKAHNKAKEHR